MPLDPNIPLFGVRIAANQPGNIETAQAMSQMESQKADTQQKQFSLSEAIGQAEDKQKVRSILGSADMDSPEGKQAAYSELMKVDPIGTMQMKAQDQKLQQERTTAKREQLGGRTAYVWNRYMELKGNGYSDSAAKAAVNEDYKRSVAGLAGERFPDGTPMFSEHELADIPPDFEPGHVGPFLAQLIGVHKAMEMGQKERSDKAAAVKVDQTERRLNETERHNRVTENLTSQKQGASGGGRPLAQPAINKLQEAGSAVDQINRIATSFEDKYGGHIIAGDMSNTVGRLAGDDTGQAQWWQDYQSYVNEQRKALFGSALTNTEKGEFYKAMVTPRMKSSEIRKNLKRQAEIVRQAARKLRGVYTATGYNGEAIESLVPEASVAEPKTGGSNNALFDQADAIINGKP